MTRRRLITVSVIGLAAGAAAFLLTTSPAPGPAITPDSPPADRISLWQTTPEPRVSLTGHDPAPLIIEPGPFLFDEDNPRHRVLGHSEVTFPRHPVDLIERSNRNADPNDVPARQIRAADRLIKHLLEPVPSVPPAGPSAPY